MIKEQQGKYTESTIFWCPPIAGKAQPLTRIWHSFGDKLSAEEQHDFVDMAKRTLAVSEQQRAEALIKQWPLWQVSAFNEQRHLNLVADFVLVLVNKAELNELPELLSAAQRISQQLPEPAPVLVAIDDFQQQNALQKHFATLNITQYPGVKLVAEPCHHASLLKYACHVVVYGSWLGFEALLWQKPVSVLGTPFYTGLGLTIDLAAGQATPHAISLAQLVYLILLEYSYSQCPHSGSEIPLEQALSWLSQQNAIRQRFPKTLYAIGFGHYWRPVVKQFLQGSQLIFVKDANTVPPAATAVIWGNKPVSELAPNCKLLRLEDGFLRSVGLGALFVKPLSWVVDSKGLYFDATTASSLELLLQNHQFSQTELDDAKQLIQQLVLQRVTKYNTGSLYWQKPQQTKPIILVVGQVETDASIACGAPGIRRNIDVLHAVRTANPDAYIIYKPHPDVVVGARASGQNEDSAASLCDEIITSVNISVMLPQVDEVHVITSLAGFEALLRGKKVVCYGQPFYAGWGLTQDIIACSRRTRTLTLEQLVAGVLMLYPLYLCPRSGYYSNALQTARVLAAQAQQQTGTRPPLWARGLRALLNIVFGKR